MEPLFEQLRDLIFVDGQAQQLRSYLRAVRQATSRSEINFATTQQVLGQLIVFVTKETDNLDALAREGLPRPAQQVLMRDGGYRDAFAEAGHGDEKPPRLAIQMSAEL